ncbi:MAG: hypothetical protein N3A64_02685, partial [Desulfobacterota bacterium]|nr:hypothetical protein [Thermodesulfobacteriota bacterium]
MRLFSFLLLLGTFFMGITTGLIDISNAMSEPVQGENKNISQESPLQPIAGKNIFSPERKDFPFPTLPSDAKTLQKPKVRPQITLYGTTLAGDYQSASI